MAAHGGQRRHSAAHSPLLYLAVGVPVGAWCRLSPGRRGYGENARLAIVEWAAMNDVPRGGSQW
jgi:hypothetical protein